ncbi:DUF6636 domain-containing protein, partial [Geminocystis sp. CENA526]|uniref:DUF6636 domain-containing protein n=1 Tax=Geminocystis sp. CENA526 TaxID=1355871 RepID=UPI003D6E047F
LLSCLVGGLTIFLSPEMITASSSSNKQNTQLTGFMMPSKNIFCALLNANELRCEIASGLKPLPSQRPPHSECVWGQSLLLPSSGKIEFLCISDTIWDNYPILSYGKKWQKSGIECLSQKTGLTCKNSTGNGFFLSRERWKVF